MNVQLLKHKVKTDIIMKNYDKETKLYKANDNQKTINLNEEDIKFFTIFSSSIVLELLHTEITSIGVYISVH